MPKKATPTENTVNREYKSSIFAMLFQDKRKLLELYNAISGTSYKDPEVLKIVTLENAIYMGLRNDLSLLLLISLSFTTERRNARTGICRNCQICIMKRKNILPWNWKW